MQKILINFQFFLWFNPFPVRIQKNSIPYAQKIFFLVKNLCWLWITIQLAVHQAYETNLLCITSGA